VSRNSPQRDLVLIIARDLASKLATPAFLVDGGGDVVYYNEAAEQLLARPFVESRGMPAAEWATAFHPVDERGEAIPMADLPLGTVITKRIPAHRAFQIEGQNGATRHIEVTALPLYSHADEFVGGIAVFWELAEES
jgi:PAS domain-containing protein